MSEEIPSITDEQWQKKKELGQFEKVFTYMGKDGKPANVKATVTIHSGFQYDQMEESCKVPHKSGIKILDQKKLNRATMKLVYGLDGTALQSILDNKGPSLYNQMRTFAFQVTGMGVSEEKVEEEKN